MDYRDPDWVAAKLGLDKNTLYRFLQDGTLPALQLGRKWLISEQRLTEWLEQETEKQTRTRRESIASPPQRPHRLDDYTAAGRKVLKLAHAEARSYGHERLDTGHVLLALALDGRSAAARALREFGITPELIRTTLQQRLSPGLQPAPRRLPRTAEAKRAMRLASTLARREAAKAHSPLAPVGTDHLLAGILLARRGVGAQILAHHNVTRRRLKESVARACKDAGDTPEGERL